PDEYEAAFLDTIGEVGILGKKAVARMYGLGIGDLGGGDQRRHAEIAVARWRRTDADGLVGQTHVLGLAIRLGMDHHGLDAEFPAGALDAERNFAAIGNEDL